MLQICRLNKNKSVPYYKLIIDPNNFMNTIHNAFQISFLFRDGVIALEEDEFGYPTVRIITESDKETFDDRTHQMVSNLTTKLVDVSYLCMGSTINDVRSIGRRGMGGRMSDIGNLCVEKICL